MLERKKIVKRFVTDPGVLYFYKNHTSRKFRRHFGIKFPIFGRYKHTMLVREDILANLIFLYLQHKHEVLGSNILLSIEKE